MRRASLQDVATTLAHIANNDLPHMQARLNYIDIRMEKIETNVSWTMKLLIAGFIVALGGAVGLVIGLIMEVISL